MNKVLGNVIEGFTDSATVATKSIASTTLFDRQYQANSNMEKALSVQVPPSSSRTTTTDLLSTIKKHSRRIREQALSLSSAHSLNPHLYTLSDQVKPLKMKRVQYLKQSNVHLMAVI
ncbi:hypothetical protein [Alicyclobacillus fodiniaquatilis]|uniref:Uncharacterized protein n=1 Tax=Alicyclobacillus fodiniaquatilis TaxID=1661150 RepID=A0ABW4JF80_9BACL